MDQENEGNLQLGGGKRIGDVVGVTETLMDSAEQVRAREVLETSEEWYRLLAENVSDVVWITDLQLNPTYLSPSIERLRGYTVEEAMAQRFEETVTPASLAMALSAFAEGQAIEQGEERDPNRVRTLKLEFLRKDGSTVWTESKISYIRDPDGRPLAITGVTRDISERRQMEEALREQAHALDERVEERTVELKRGHQRERALNALLRLSMEDISLDEQLERALGEILSIPWLPVQPRGAIFLVRDDTPSGAGTLELRAQRGFNQASQTACKRISFGQCLCGRAAANQNLVFAEHGDERHELHHEGVAPHGHYCMPILSGKKPIGTIALYLEQGHTRDIHQEDFLRAVADTLAGIIERRRAEEALQQSETRLAEAQRIARLGNWEWEIETDTLYWSDEIYRIFGLAPQEFGATYEAFLNSVHPDDRDFVRRSVNEALHGHKPYSIDHHIVLPDGSERVVHEQAEVTYGPSGKPLRMVGTVQDVTERKRAEVAVLEERGRLARDLHDSVTQSLYSITLLAEGWKRLQRAGRLEDTEDPLAELGEIAQQALKEMRLMVHELRPPDLEEVGLVGALHQRLGAVEKRAGVDARLVADDVAELSPRVEECLYRIAIEALNNALKHASATSVVVRIRIDGDRVEMAVKDNGCGFDVKTLNTRRGMGLKGMQERTEQLGGAFHVDSTPSEGTTVSVNLRHGSLFCDT